MAKCGNHGQIIPRDKELLQRLYIDQNLTTVQMAAIFGVEYRSIQRVMESLGIPRRKPGSSRWEKCRLCGNPAQKIVHAKNGSSYGTLCAEHRKSHRDSVRHTWEKTDSAKTSIKSNFSKWYKYGPKKPKDEKQWTTKSRALLRTAKRILKSPAQ